MSIKKETTGTKFKMKESNRFIVNLDEGKFPPYLIHTYNPDIYSNELTFKTYECETYNSYKYIYNELFINKKSISIKIEMLDEVGEIYETHIYSGCKLIHHSQKEYSWIVSEIDQREITLIFNFENLTFSP